MARVSSLYLAAVVVVVLAVALGQAQTLASGTVSNVQLYNNGAGPGVCPTDFWTPPGSPNHPVCYSATMNCSAHSSTVPSLNFIYSYINPPSTVSGSVVIFSGGSGTLGTLGQHNIMAAGLYGANYEVIEVAWQTDWEQTSDQLGIMTAACRPAGFLNYVLQTPLLNSRLGTATNGLCVAGSAGSGATAYALTQYTDQNGVALSSDLDDVELTSGPVFSNIQVGCESTINNTLSENICAAGQYGCSSGTTPWANQPFYVGSDVSQVATWTNLSTCEQTSQTGSQQQKWLAMSIVNGTSGSFSYPSMSMAGWLCASSAANSCTTPCPNNSAAQGNMFLSQITSGSQALAFKITGITGCSGAEGVAYGTDPDPGALMGEQAIVNHVMAQCKHPSPN